MVGLIVRLRFAMWRTAMTRSPLHLVSSILGGLAALGVLAVLGPGLVLLSQRPLRITALTVPLFTVITLMWTVLSLIATGVDSILDPARFSVLPLRAGELARGLLAAACTGIPAVMLIGLGLAQVGSWLGYPAAVPAALLGAVLGVLTAILLSRAVTSALARVMTTRVGRVLGAAVVSVVTLIPLTMNTLLTTGSLGTDLSSFDATRSAVVASWTPFGWAWALPFDVATGRWVSFVVHLALAVSFVAVLYAVWVRLLARTLTSPLTSSGGQRIGRGRLLPVLLGTSPTASIAARRVRAWYRDSRLVGIALRTFVLPIFFVRAGGVHGHPGAGRHRHRHPGRVRRADPDERPRLRRARLVAARRRRRARLGGPARPRDRLDRGLRPGRRADLRRERGARRHLEPGVVADRGRGVVLRQPRPGRRGGCGAARARHHAPAATRSRRRRAVPRRAA